MTIKTEHAGAKNSGGYWGKRVEAKRRSKKARRGEDLAVTRTVSRIQTDQSLEDENGQTGSVT